MQKLDHIAIVTEDISASRQFYEKLLGVPAGEEIDVPDQGIVSAFIPLRGVGIELLEPTDPNGGIQKFLDKKGPGIHHIALHVDSLEEAVNAYSKQGIHLIIGSANGQKSVFLHPKDTGGVLIELCE